MSTERQFTINQAQVIHDTARSENDDHDRVSCWCCCVDCDFDFEAVLTYTAKNETRER